MSMVKLFYSDSFDTTADVGMRLFEDTSSLKKSASTIFGMDYDALKPDKDHVGIHVVALGAHERYGCFFEGAPVSTAAGQVAIQDVKVGDLVLTHAGNYKPVLKTFSSEYSGDRATLTFRGMPDPVECTAEHPFLIVRRDGLSPASIWKLREADTLADELDRRVASAEWVPADRVRPGDFAVIPTELSPEQAATTESPAPEYDPYVSGFYLAEGCLTKEYKDIFTKGEVKSVLITCAEGDAAALDYIDGWLVSIGRKPAARGESYTSAVGVRYMFGYKEYATWLEKTFGGHAESKHLAPTVWKWDREQRLKFLAGYFDGDGCLQHGDNRYTGTLTVSTASRTLALDVQRLLASVGIPSSVCQCWNKVSNGCFGHGDFKIYSLSVGGYQSNKIIKYSTRFTQHTRQFKQRGSASMQLGHKYALVPVTKVALDQVENKTKYNLEIADDNSYVVDVQAHNCNRNFDAFSKSACLKYHDTFVKHGHVYRHHRNKDPEKALGQIKVSAYNPEMDRVELFIHANKEKAADELTRLEKEGEIPFSMAAKVPNDRCFPAGTFITTDKGVVPIEEIAIGTRVLTEQGNWKPVTACHLNMYSGTMVSVKPHGLPRVDMTANHPIFVVPGTHMRLSNGRRATLDIDNNDKWAHTSLGALSDVKHVIDAEDLDVSDFTVSPKLPLSSSTLFSSYAYVAGRYCGDGSIVKQRRGRKKDGDNYVTGVSFSCSESEPEMLKLKTALAEISDKPIHVRHERNKRAYVVQVTDRKLAQELSSSFGEYWHGKRVDFSALTSIGMAYSFIGGLIDSDGSFDHKKLTARICGSGTRLLYGAQQLLQGAGVLSSLGRVEYSADGFKRSQQYGWVIYIGGSYISTLRPYACKLAAAGERRAKLNTQIWDNSILRGIKDIEYYVVDRIPVYNLTVEDDETYVAGILSVHNCSICGTFRKNASDPNQCDHIKNEFGKTYDDGKVAFTFNDEPDFFDISFVGRPADRIAWQLKVASADTASSIKLAEYEGVTLPDSLAIDSKIGLRKLAHLKAVVYMHDAYRGWFTKTAQQKSSRDFYLYELRKAAGAKLPDSVIARLREFEPAAAFTAMAKAGMVMDVESFFKYAMGPEYRQLKDLMPEISLAVPRVMKTAVDSGTCQNLCNVSTFDVPERQSYMAGEVPGSLIVKMASAAVVGQPRDERIIAATVEQKNIKFAVDTAKKIESNTALTEALAEKYAAYQLSAIDAVLSFHDTDPDYVRAISAAQNLMM